MSGKAIPDGDTDFGEVARVFAICIGRDFARYGVSQEDADAIVNAVDAFHAANSANANRGTRSSATAARKDKARYEAEVLIRRARNLIRANPNVSVEDRASIGLKERPTRLRKRACPDTPPKLLFVAQSLGDFFNRGNHVIRFYDQSRHSKAKPEGATRLELFVELIPPGEPIPAEPRKLHGSILPYLRSYTRSPMKVKYPKSDMPMRIVYWGAWANSTGEIGPMSEALVAPIEGAEWSQFSLPSPDANAIELSGSEPGRVKQTVVITSARRELPDRVETIDTLRAESSRMLPDKNAA